MVQKRKGGKKGEFYGQLIHPVIGGIMVRSNLLIGTGIIEGKKEKCGVNLRTTRVRKKKEEA